MQRTSTRRLIRPNDERQILTVHLFNLYRKHKSYQNIVARLQPLRKRAGVANEWPNSPFSEYRNAKPGTRGEAVEAYVNAVYRALVNRLRLFEGEEGLKRRGMLGQVLPAEWAATTMDVDVRIWPEQGGSVTLGTASLECATVHIQMTPGHATVTLAGTDDVEKRSDLPLESPLEVLPVGRAAKAMIDAWLSDVAGRFQKIEYRKLNTGTMEQQLRDVEMLFEYLFLKKRPTEDSDRKRLQRIAKRADLTLPP